MPCSCDRMSLTLTPPPFPASHLNLPMLSLLSALSTPTFWRQSPISTSSAPSSLPTLHLLELVRPSVASLRRDSGEGRK